jgi:peptidoglycan/xylan/chitin deacetylase (PgdA/CDA1 family)
MIKKTYKIILIVLLLGYSILIGYQFYNNNKNLNDLIKFNNSLKSSYKSSVDKVKSLEENINNINMEKDNMSSVIKEEENNLKKVNDKIALKTKQTIGSGKGPKVAYLTFDDGPSIYTNRVLDILKEYNVKATFFVNGRSDANSLSIYRRIVNEGHSIGNHTYTHKFQNIYTSVQAFDNDFNSLQDLILRTTGVTMDIMRFPGGSNNAISDSYSLGIMNTLTVKYKNMGYKYFDWNASAGDSWEGTTTSYAIDNITRQCRYKSFAIILMHDSRPTTPDALKSAIQNLTGFGFKFLPLSTSTPVVQFK